MRVLKVIALTLLSAACTPVFAQAADMAPRPPVISAEQVMPDETGAGWYLRGDVGFARNVAPTLSWQSTSYSNRTTADSGTFDLGFGYRFSESLRSDVTLDFLTDHHVSGTLSATQSDRVTQESGALLLNGYYDFAKFMAVTPYIGAGIGVARVVTDPLSRSVSGTPTYTFASATQYVMTAAAMAGLSFDIGRGLQADIGYKFNWIDKTRTGSETTGALSGPVNIGDFSSHQIRVGLKYFIN
jgi:opacity protein-like surface antigen